MEADVLSAYLDGELPAAEARALEDHVGRCPSCRAELDGLAAVVGKLSRLERQAPPSVLAQQVTRRVAVEGRPTGLIARVEAMLRRIDVDPGTMVTFGVVVALAAMLALLGSSLEEAARRRQAMEAEWSGLQVVTAVVGDHRFDRDGGLWREVGAGEPEVRLPASSPEARAILDATPRLRDLLAHSEGVVLLDDQGRTILIEGDGAPGAAP
jgi:anti-sigma factor RsiW